jgi:uncharacterized protein YndB with AHSA1/START domain
MELRRELVLPHSPGDVWEALTDPRRLEEWFANDVELDVTPGGGGRFRWADGATRRAIVENVDEERCLSLRWWAEEAPDDETLVTMSLEEADEGTKVVVTETTTGPTACAGEWGWALELLAAFSLQEAYL